MKIRDDLSKGMSLYPIPVYNNVDNNENINGDSNIFIYTQKIVTSVKEEQQYNRDGCRCVNGCFKSKCKCIDKSTIELYPNGRIKNIGDLYNKFDEKILYECDSKTCLCKGKCGNRMTPNKFNLKVNVYKTSSAGYGVRTDQYIQSGSFVAEFVGEILSNEEVYNRKNVEEYSYNVWNEDYSKTHFIDPTRYGNISRFFNHSCLPSLIPIRYYSSHRMEWPSLGFVSLGDLVPGDELTINYGEAYWKRLIETNNNFFCECSWFYCQFPVPDKPQLSLDNALKLAAKLTQKNHKKFKKYQKNLKKKMTEKNDFSK